MAIPRNAASGVALALGLAAALLAELPAQSNRIYQQQQAGMAQQRAREAQQQAERARQARLLADQQARQRQQEQQRQKRQLADRDRHSADAARALGQAGRRNSGQKPRHSFSNPARSGTPRTTSGGTRHAPERTQGGMRKPLQRDAARNRDSRHSRQGSEAGAVLIPRSVIHARDRATSALKTVGSKAAAGAKKVGSEAKAAVRRGIAAVRFHAAVKKRANVHATQQRELLRHHLHSRNSLLDGKTGNALLRERFDKARTEYLRDNFLRVRTPAQYYPGGKR